MPFTDDGGTMDEIETFLQSLLDAATGNNTTASLMWKVLDNEIS